MAKFIASAFDRFGNALPFASVHVTDYLTGATVSLTNDDGSAKANPFPADSDGVYGFNVAVGTYNIATTYQGTTKTYTKVDVGSSGGGGGSGGTVTGGTNLGATGVSVFDAASSTPTTLKFKKLLASTNVTITDNGDGTVSIAAAGGGGGGGGTVSSVALAAPSMFTVSGSPVTATGTLAFALANQGKHQVLAGPVSGAAAVPAFRQITHYDVALIHKMHVDVVSTSNVSVSSAPASIDGIAVNTGARVLLTGQSTGHENGIWIHNGAAVAMTRPEDYDAGTTLQAFFGVQVQVTMGTYQGAVFRISNPTTTITIGTTSTTWALVATNINTVYGTLPVANGGSGATTAANARANLGMAVWQINGHIENPTAKSYTITLYAEFAFTIDRIRIVTSGGTCTALVAIDGVTVTGLGAIAVTSTPQHVTASALNAVAIGQKITLTLSSITNAADLQFSLKYTR